MRSSSLFKDGCATAGNVFSAAIDDHRPIDYMRLLPRWRAAAARAVCDVPEKPQSGLHPSDHVAVLIDLTASESG
jgi:hypothetical protein